MQGSDDPEIFGMEEQAPTSINYYLDGTDENKEKVRKVLDEQYDILKVPKDKRVYRIDPKNGYKDLEEVDDIIDRNAYRPYDETKDKDIIPYAISDETAEKLGWKKDENGHYPSAVPTDPKYPLARCRVYLGVKILSDLEISGYCDLDAEV